MSTESTSPTALAPFGSLTSELEKIAPPLEIQANQIQILKEPKDFYESLKRKIGSAKKRVFISTLYVGKAEYDLISTLRDALLQSPQLRVSILTDYLRGTREAPEPSCASLLSSLAAEFGDRVDIRMFHTPNLAGFKKTVLPKRINEGWGLQHMKLYGFDDEIILSGANLSNDYFTNRQDRYHLFSSAEVTRFYEQFHDAVCNLSFRLIPSQTNSAQFSLEWPTDNAGPSPLKDSKEYMQHAANVFKSLLDPSSRKPALKSSTTVAEKMGDAPTGWTLLYPLFQLTPLFPKNSPSSQSTELPALQLLLQSLSQRPLTPAKWTFTAGYFNMTPSTRDLLLSSLQQSSIKDSSSSERSEPYGRIITAHPHANGFFGSAGVSGMLPPAYTLMSKRFLEAVRKKALQDRLSLYEWKRGTVGHSDGWTYHAKGLWVTLPDARNSDGDNHELRPNTKPESSGPAITLIGSSNYTKRSHTLDLEANALILTTDGDLQRRLGQEEEHIMRYVGRKIEPRDFETPERRVGLRVRIALWITNMIGGAL